MASTPTDAFEAETGLSSGAVSAEVEEHVQLLGLKAHPDATAAVASSPQPADKREEDAAEAATTAESDTEAHSDTTASPPHSLPDDAAELQKTDAEETEATGEEHQDTTELPTTQVEEDAAAEAAAEAAAAASAAEEAARLREEAREAKRRREVEKRRERTKRRNVLERCTCMQCTFESLQGGEPCPGRACPICLAVPPRKSAVTVFKSKPPGACDSHGVCWGCMRHWIEVKVLEEGTSVVRCPGEGCNHQLERDNLIQALGAVKPTGTMAKQDEVMQRHEELKRVEENGAERLLQVIEQAETDDEARTLLDNCQVCPWCLRLVERSTGCRCMSCRCGKGFCYECGQDLASSCVCATYENFRNVGGPTLGLWMAFQDSSPEDLDIKCRAHLRAAILPRLKKVVEVRVEAMRQEREASLCKTEEIVQQRESARQNELKEAAQEKERKAAAALGVAASRNQRKNQKRKAAKAAPSKSSTEAAGEGSTSASSSSDAAAPATPVQNADSTRSKRGKRGGKGRKARSSNPEVTETSITTDVEQPGSSSTAASTEPQTASVVNSGRRQRRRGKAVEPTESAELAASSSTMEVATAASGARQRNRDRQTLVWVVKK